MAESKLYVPKCSAKARTTTFGEILNVSFHADTLKAFIVEHTNDRGYLNLTISKRKAVGPYGDTHSVALDTWKPNGQQQSAPAQQQANDDVPGLR